MCASLTMQIKSTINTLYMSAQIFALHNELISSSRYRMQQQHATTTTTITQIKAAQQVEQSMVQWSNQCNLHKEPACPLTSPYASCSLQLALVMLFLAATSADSALVHVVVSPSATCAGGAFSYSHQCCGNGSW